MADNFTALMWTIRQFVSSSVVFGVHFSVLFIEEIEECLCEDHIRLSPRISFHLKISCITHQGIPLEKTEGALCAQLEDVPERQKELLCACLEDDAHTCLSVSEMW